MRSFASRKDFLNLMDVEEAENFGAECDIINDLPDDLIGRIEQK